MSVVQLFTNGQLRAARPARATRPPYGSFPHPGLRQRSPGLALPDPGLNTVGLPGLTSWPSRAGKSSQRLALPGKPKYGYPSGIGIWPLPRRSLFHPFRSKRLLNQESGSPNRPKEIPRHIIMNPVQHPWMWGAGAGSHENFGVSDIGGHDKHRRRLQTDLQ